MLLTVSDMRAVGIIGHTHQKGATMKLPIIQSLWIGDDLTNVEKLCVQSFLDNGHEFHLYTYTDIGGIPSGAVVKDGNEIVPESDIFLHKRGTYAIFADWFRLALLAKRGGVWVDMDMICLKPFDFPPEQIILAAENSHFCTNTVMMFPKGHPLIVALEQNFHSFQNKANSGWGKIGGPKALTKAIKEHSMQTHVFPFYYFLPISWTEWHTAFDKTYADDINFFANTYSIHLSNEMGRRNNTFDKNAVFDSQSLFEQLKEKHGITNSPTAKRITSEQLHKATIDNKITAIAKRKNRINRTRLLLLLIAFAIGFTAGLLL